MRNRKRNLRRRMPAILTPVKQGDVWRVRIAWSNSRSHHFGAFTSEKEAIGWITTHTSLTRTFTESRLGEPSNEDLSPPIHGSEPNASDCDR